MKHKFNVFRLHFESPLHLGDEKEDYSESLRMFHSDSLYAAMTSALFKVGELPKDGTFNGDLGAVVSSLFPFYQKDTETSTIYFFPKLRKVEILDESMLEKHKEIKKIKWLDQAIFEKQLNGNVASGFYSEANIQEEFLSTQKLPDNFISAQVFPRVTVSRNGMEDAEPFYMERLFFKDYSGLFFIVTGELSLVRKALKILQYEGIGTDRTVGNGFFKLEEDVIELDLPSDPGHAMNLSLYLPDSEKKLQRQIEGKTAYNLKKRGGWISTPPYNTLRKNRIYMFEEGGLFNSSENTYFSDGKIANLKPCTEKLPKELKNIHNIWRCGKALFLPLNLKIDE